MAWEEPWVRAEALTLARYVTADAADVVPIVESLYDLARMPGGPRNVLEAIYNELLTRQIHYALEPYHNVPGQQRILTPAEALANNAHATCLDLATAFAGLCLAYRLNPLLVVVDNHVVVAVPSGVSNRDTNPHHAMDPMDARNWNPEGLLDRERSREQAERAVESLLSKRFYIVECTGLAASATLTPKRALNTPETRNRSDGVMKFADALIAGRAQLLEREFQFALDIVVAQDAHGLKPFALPASSGPASAARGVIGRVVALADKPTQGPLIGRVDTITDVTRRLRTGDTVGVFAFQGMGGVGKTALAAAAADVFADDTQTFPGGVIWLACSSQKGDSGLVAVLTQVARLTGRDDLVALTDLAQLRQGLSTALRARPRTLLVLDNVAPELDAALALQTLVAPGHTTLLLTARDDVATNLVHIVRVAPLTTDLATQLFAQRLAQATGEVSLTVAEEAQIPPLVEAVGGLPLAVELLAAYAGRHKGGQAQHQDQSDHLAQYLAAMRAELATSGINAAAFKTDPQRIVTEVFDRSWHTLPAHRQRLFAGLGLLPEVGFPSEVARVLAAASASGSTHVAGSQVPQRPHTVSSLDVELDALVRAALIEPLANDRLRLHPMLHAYARDRLATLDPATRDALGDAMLAYWLIYARAHPGYQGMNSLEAEAPGLMSALAWAHEHKRWQLLQDLARTLNQAWDVRGRRFEELRMYGWAVEGGRRRRRSRGGRKDLRWALHQLAVTQVQVGMVPEASAGFKEALALARELEDKAAIREELYELAVRDSEKANSEGAQAGFKEALALARELEDKAAIRTALHALAVLDVRAGNLEGGRVGLEEALALARELGETRSIRIDLHELAVVNRRAGNSEDARAGYEEALALARELEDKAAIRDELHVLAVLDVEMGNPEGGRAGLEKALALARELSDVASQSVELQSLGAFDLNHGNATNARSELDEALSLARRSAQPTLVADAAFWLAVLNQREGRREVACAGFREALTIYERQNASDAEITRQHLRELDCLP